MAKIVDPDLLNIGTELVLDTVANTFQLVATGNLVAKDGVTIQALYSKFIELWTSDTYNRYDFPMYTIDSKSGQYIFGFDGSSYSGWKPLDDTTRQMLRDGGWSEFSGAGVLNRQYVGIVSLGEVNTGAQLYYQKEQSGTAIDFTFDDAVNEGIQVYGDATNGNFDTRTYFKGFVREYGYRYRDSSLADTGQTSTGAYTVNLLLSNDADLKILDDDTTVSTTTPYTNITVEYLPGVGFTAWANTTVYPVNSVVSSGGNWYYTALGGTSSGTNPLDDVGVTDWVPYVGERSIGGTNYAFNVVIDGAFANAEEIYTKIQYLLRQASDIDAGTGSVVGRTADLLLNFLGDTLITTKGVYIDDYDPNDINRLVFTDATNVQRTEPFTSAGTLNFNSFLTTGGTGYYRMYFTDLPLNLDYGLVDAVTVNDSTDTPITGVITSASISFTFAYDTNTQGGRTQATDAFVTIVAGNVGYAKPVVASYTITRSTGLSFTLTAEQDRAYLNP